MAYQLVPLNDFTLEWTIRVLDLDPASDSYGRRVPLVDEEAGVIAFLATSNGPTAAAADPTLSVSCDHVGGGRWISNWNASVLTPALLAEKFAAAKPYAICIAPGDARQYADCEYVPQKAAIAG